MSENTRRYDVVNIIIFNSNVSGNKDKLMKEINGYLRKIGLGNIKDAKEKPDLDTKIFIELNVKVDDKTNYNIIGKSGTDLCKKIMEIINAPISEGNDCNIASEKDLKFYIIFNRGEDKRKLESYKMSLSQKYKPCFNL